MKKLYREIVKTWGTEPQFRQAQEEAAELIQAINKLYRSEGLGQPTGASKSEAMLNLYSEVADVEIMVGQLRVMLGDGPINVAKRAKLERVKRKLKEYRAQLARAVKN